MRLLCCCCLFLFTSDLWDSVQCPCKVADNQRLHFCMAVFLLQDICCCSSSLIQPPTFFTVCESIHSSPPLCLNLSLLILPSIINIFVPSPFCPLILFSVLPSFCHMQNFLKHFSGSCSHVYFCHSFLF